MTDKRNALYSAAKRRALSQMAHIEADAPAPDEVRFLKGDTGFVIFMKLLSGGDYLYIQRMLSWTDLEMGGVMKATYYVDQMMKELAKAAAGVADE